MHWTVPLDSNQGEIRPETESLVFFTSYNIDIYSDDQNAAAHFSTALLMRAVSESL